MVFEMFAGRRRARVRAQPFPSVWRAILERNLAFFRRLSEADREELLGHVRIFLAEKHFEGAGGLDLTDEIRVTIAAQACLLLLHRKTDYYPELTSIIVYPTGYTSYEARHLEGNIWDGGGEPRLGQTARRLRSLVLAWDDAKRGAAHPSDGRNLVLHEFAHQLDYEDFQTDGAPALATRAEYVTWARGMSRELAALQSAGETGTSTVLDTYGATNPAEFFAVVTEAFFERPRALRGSHPELYAQLARFFRQDPSRYSAEATTTP